MSQVGNGIKILAPFPTNQKTILLNGKGVNTEVIQGLRFMNVPYEDIHNLGVVAGSVKVLLTEEGTDPDNPDDQDNSNTIMPQGLFAEGLAPVQNIGGSDDVLQLIAAEFPRNKNT